MALVPAALHRAPVAAAIAATGVLTGIVIADAARARHNPAEMASPPEGG